MARNNLTPEQKAYIRENAILGATTLAETLKVDRAAIYQLATDEKFSVKKGGKGNKIRDRTIAKYRRGYCLWPRPHRQYKQELVERDGLRCHYCDVMMTYQEAQVDHVLAKARGGTDFPTNLVLACFRCNSLKSTLCYSCPEFRNAIT